MATKEPTEALFMRAKQGERAAFEELLEGYLPRLKEQIQARMGEKVKSRLEAEDVLQDTLACAFESIGKFKWQGEESFYRWLGSIAEHLIWNAAQKKDWSPLELEKEPPASGVSPSKALRRDERFDRLEKALGALSADRRQALILSRMEGLKVKEIAVRMHRSPDAVQKLLARAILQLKRAFGDTESLHLPDRVFKNEEGKTEEGSHGE